ncbi:phthiotriol/phenolphthiotriol dimycocerosates methyltransferase [Mycobacterium heidelbergense]|uniref:phthiotriol/phenolphthiotriol dimycocerosates methyltransferase n=1 Tax=Mycobacterium heidelbergense TaxID=53376 RepID=UPI003557FBC1
MPIADRLLKKYWYPLVYSAPVSRLAQHAWYPISTRLMARDELVFMNWAYEEDPPMALPLEPADEHNRFYIQLYSRVATQADLTGKRVLEVGCGHGGGASYLARTLRPASYTGLDLNSAGIDFCRNRHKVPGLEFVQGNAEDLPFGAESFDAVINVESSHLYARFPRFLAEVARVLRPGGHFLYTDVRKRDLVAEWEAALEEAPLRRLSQQAIDAEVMRGLEKTQRMMGLVSHRAPLMLRGIARRIDRMQTSTFYHALRSGDYSYRLYSFVKD